MECRRKFVANGSKRLCKRPRRSSNTAPPGQLQIRHLPNPQRFQLLNTISREQLPPEHLKPNRCLRGLRRSFYISATGNNWLQFCFSYLRGEACLKASPWHFIQQTILSPSAEIAVSRACGVDVRRSSHRAQVQGKDRRGASRPTDLLRLSSSPGSSSAEPAGFHIPHQVFRFDFALR